MISKSIHLPHRQRPGRLAWAACACCAGRCRCSASTWRPSTCARTPTYERVVAEPIKSIDPARDYLRDEAGRIEMLLEELATRAARSCRGWIIPTKPAASWRSSSAAARPPALRQGAVPNHHLQDRRRLRPAGSRWCSLKEAGLLRPAEGVLDEHHPALRDHRRPAERRRGDGLAVRHPRLHGAAGRPASSSRK